MHIIFPVTLKLLFTLTCEAFNPITVLAVVFAAVKKIPPTLFHKFISYFSSNEIEEEFKPRPTFKSILSPTLVIFFLIDKFLYASNTESE